MFIGEIFLYFFLAVIFVILATFAYAGISAAPWVPLWPKEVRRMLDLAQVKAGENLYDLGAGDGRIIIMAVKEFKAKAVGFEMAVLPYFLGYIRILLSGIKPKPKLVFANFFKRDLSPADVICVFLTPPAMKKLKSKFEQEAKKGCRIVSYAFSVPGWQPTAVDKPNQKTTPVYLYLR
ncbi:MAG: hypothetical protein HY979_01395 [Candidatus Magasanikbacteria bacterium]|nr:hypothetical protein [Candidatus Magasanikbacteria bacterium]